MIGTSTNGAAHTASANGVNGACGAADAAPGKSGRDARGRFVRGNAGGPGNPFARRVAQFRRTLCEAVTDADIQAVARALVEKAKQGDVAAARLLLSYTIGQPAPAVDPDTLDLAEWDIYRRTPANPHDLEALLGGMPAALACQLAGILAPCLYDRAAQALGDQLGTDAAAAAAATGGAPADAPRAGADERAAPPSTNGANGRRAGPAPKRPRKRARATKRRRVAARQRRVGAAAPSPNGANGHARVPAAAAPHGRPSG